MTYPVGGLAVLYGTLSPGGQIRHFYTDRKPGTHEREREREPLIEQAE